MFIEIADWRRERALKVLEENGISYNEIGDTEAMKEYLAISAFFGSLPAGNHKMKRGEMLEQIQKHREALG